MGKKRILFVDECQNVLDGIQRQLRPYRNQWQIFFVTTAADALEIMSQHPIDLIVCDLIMSTVSAAELLTEVSRLYPGTVRMILSGYSDEDSLKSGLAIAHQYLSKPCSIEILYETISQIFKIQSAVNNPLIGEGIGDPNSIPSLPKIYQALNSALKDESTTTQDLVKLFASDMVLSARLLQIVNSPCFGLNRMISSLRESIDLVGTKKLHSLVLSAHIKTSFPVKEPQVQHYMERIWEDAEQVAELARLISISENQRDDRPDQAYLGGLLRNMGLMIFLSHDSARLNALLDKLKTSGTPPAELEKEVFGFTRSEAAAYVLSLWKIPPRIIEAVLLQYNPNDTDYDQVNALTAVHVAACLLRPAIKRGDGRLFDIKLDMKYLKRLNKLEQLTKWRKLAKTVQIHYQSSWKA